MLFINADREYAEGKNQNKLRPEDIEKIDFVFTHKRELPKYSRLAAKSEIVDTHDHNLNICRYVDNTPAPMASISTFPRSDMLLPQSPILNKPGAGGAKLCAIRPRG